MVEAGYWPPKVARDPHDQRYEAVRPNQLWHLDFVHRHINRANTFTWILIDDHSRFVVGRGVDDADRADLVTSTFEAALKRHGRPECVMHDKGSASGRGGASAASPTWAICGLEIGHQGSWMPTVTTPKSW